MDIAEVRAAINKSEKNKVPQTEPYASCGNIEGKIKKIRPGPPAGSAPRANTVVKIATPASIAIAVSKAITHKAEFNRFWFRSR